MSSANRESYLRPADYVVVAGTLLFSLCVGLYYAIRKKSGTNNEELLAGSRKMREIPIAASMVVTSLNAITILGYPAEVYAYGSQIYLLTPVGTFTALIGIFLFARVLYPLKLTSAYTYLEGRFDSCAVRVVSSLIYLFQLLLGTGVVVYAPAIALETIIGIPFWISVIGMVICGTVYTSIGGLSAVVWTDVFQFVMILIGMTAIVAKAIYEAGGISTAFQVAGDKGRLELFNWSVDPFMRHNTLNIVLGSGFTGFFGAVSPPSVQRYCSLPTFRGAVKSYIWSFAMQAVMISLVIFTGLLMFSVYADCDPVTSGKIQSADQIVPYFVVNNLNIVPGLIGLFTAVIFSAVLSTISSVLNTLAALTWEDVLLRFNWFKEMEDCGQAWTYRILSVTYGGILIALGFWANNLGPVVQAAILIAGTAIGIQGSIFFVGMFMPFINGIGASVGMIVGVALMGFYSLKAFNLQKTITFQQSLDYSVDGCNVTMLSASSTSEFLLGNGTSTENYDIMASSPTDDLEWSEKIFTMSYVLYSLIGGIITITVSIIASLLTGGLTQAKSVDPKYLHPLVRPKSYVDFDMEAAEGEKQSKKMLKMKSQSEVAEPTVWEQCKQ